MNNKPKVIENIGDSILDLRYIFSTDKIISKNANQALSKWQDYVDHYEKIKQFFENTLLVENPYLNRTYLNKFYKEYLSFIDTSAELALKSSITDINLGEEELLKKYELPISEYSQRLKKRDNGYEDITPLLVHINKLSKDKNQSVTKFHDKKKTEIQQPFYFFLYKFLDRFHTVLSKCETKTEEAVFISFICYNPFNDLWIFHERFDAKVTVDEHQLDFVYRDLENQILLNIEIEEKSFQDRTESEVIRDKNRDLDLQGKGWFVLRFSKREVEEHLAGCAERVKDFYNMRASQNKERKLI